MTESNHQLADSSTDDEGHRARLALLRGLASVRRRVPAAVGAAAFWSAVVIPLVYPPLLVGGLDDDVDWAVFLCVLVGHAIALALGRAHQRG